MRISSCHHDCKLNDIMPIISALVCCFTHLECVIKLIGILNSYTCSNCKWNILMQVFLFVTISNTLIHRNNRMWNVKLKHNTGWPWQKEQQASLSTLYNGAIITISCLYTDGSSMREFLVSPCQHNNLHKCIYHWTCMLTPTYCNFHSRLNEQWEDI